MAARQKTAAGPARAATVRRTRGRSTRGRLAPDGAVRGLSAAEIALGRDSPEVEPLVDWVRQAGGTPIGAYRDPLGGRVLLLASIPLAAIQPTPFQRDLSPTHTQRLAARIAEAGAFLDPLIAVRGEDGRLWTPNGRHRLAAAKVLGLRQITALICPDETLAYRILALNTEKAHNLRDRSLEVIRMARNLAQRDRRASEASRAAEFESPELLTLGLLYERSERFAGGAYSAFLKKVDRFSERPLASSLRQREDYAARLLEIDTQVKRLIEALQARGFRSPYLRNYLVARFNPVRFHESRPDGPRRRAGQRRPAAGQVRGEAPDTPPMPMAQALTRMLAAARSFKLDSVSHADVAWVAVGAGAAE